MPLDHASQLRVVPTGAAVGASVPGLDLRQVNDTLFTAIYEAWLTHSVLIFPGQRLAHEDLIAFSRRFGELDHAPVQENGRRFVEGLPEIYIVSNVLGPDGQPIGSLGAGEASWHTDMSYLPQPPKASLLYAAEIPHEGGDTWFAGMHAAWQALPASMQARLRGLRVNHDGTYNSGGFLRAGVVPTDDPRDSPGTLHPLVCRHPETGREALYLGRRRNAWIEGMELGKSDALLDEIWAEATASRHVYRHRWGKGDLVLWDNRNTMHRRDPFDPAARRVMYRTQVKGSAPPMA